jgi:hypothetical protein
MTLLEFANGLKILRSIDECELVEAGVIAAGDGAAWHRFRSNPPDFLIRCDDERAEKLWSVIERRMLPAVPKFVPARPASQSEAHPFGSGHVARKW